MTAKFLLMLLLMSLHLPAVSWVGKYEEGYIAFQRGDYATALQKWQPLAEEGSAHAQLSVGTMYDKGQGCRRIMRKLQSGIARPLIREKLRRSTISEECTRPAGA